jgi:transcriptional regulator with XRE-family HTH domain
MEQRNNKPVVHLISKPDNMLKTIYTANLKALRTFRKWNQAELSEKVGISEKFYNDIETGRKWGSFETIVDLANAFEVEPYELFLPQGTVISHDEKRTKDLMKRLRTNFSELVDTMEEFLAEKK